VHYALALRESVHGAQRSVPWVRERLVRSSQAYVGAYELRADALEEQLSGLDLTDPSSMQQIGNVTDAGALLGAMRSERQGPL
ncbi:zinc-dependent metalloprotease, partial [Acinetobacter baumannii]